MLNNLSTAGSDGSMAKGARYGTLMLSISLACLAVGQAPPQASNLLAPPAISAADLANPDALLKLAILRTMANRRQTMAYTYSIAYRNRNFSPRGRVLADYSATYDIVFVGGLPYRKQVEEDHRPLSSAAATKEAQLYDRAFAERSHMSLEQKRDYLRRPWNVDVPLPQLTALFQNRILGQDLVNGRPAIITESLPLERAQPVDEEERRALHKRVKLWIDRDDLIVSRIEATLIADDAAMKSGTVALIDFVREDGVWLPARSDVRFQAESKAGLVLGETTETNSDFHRFRVDVRLLEPLENGNSSEPAQ